MRRVVFALVLGFATAAAAQTTPPNPAVPAVTASCIAGDEPAKVDDIAVHADAVPISDLDGARDMVGRMLYLGGAKLTSDDPRFGDIIGLALDEKLGLVAATGAGNWIIFDVTGPALLNFKSVKTAPMRGLPGAPAALARVGQSIVVAAQDGHSLDRYDLDACGLTAHASSLGGFQTSDQVVGLAPASGAYTLFAGTDSTGSRHDLVATTAGPEMKLTDPQVPALAGYELVDIAGPEVIVPYDMIGLWRRAGGGQRTRVQTFTMPNWTDILSVKNLPPSLVLADLPLPMRAVTGYYDRANKLVRLYMISQAGPKEPTYLLAFAMPSITG